MWYTQSYLWSMEGITLSLELYWRPTTMVALERKSSNILNELKWNSSVAAVCGDFAWNLLDCFGIVCLWNFINYSLRLERASRSKASTLAHREYLCISPRHLEGSLLISTKEIVIVDQTNDIPPTRPYNFPSIRTPGQSTFFNNWLWASSTQSKERNENDSRPIFGMFQSWNAVPETLSTV